MKLLKEHTLGATRLAGFCRWAAILLFSACVCCTTVRAADDAHGDETAAAPAEHGAEHGDGHGAPDPLAFDPDLAFWTLVVFFVLLAVLGKFAWGPIIESLNKREKEIAENIDQARRSGEEARAMLAEYQRKISSAADEVRGMMEEARRDAEHTKSTIIAEARSEAEKERDRALRDIQTAADQASKDLAERGADLAVNLAGKIVQDRLSSADHDKLIREAVDKFGGQPSQN